MTMNALTPHSLLPERERGGALPISLAAGATVVVKLGGATLGGTTFDGGGALLEEVAELSRAGLRVVLVHGGGPLITTWLERLGVPTRFREGQRVTDEAALEVATMILRGTVNTGIVAALGRIKSYFDYGTFTPIQVAAISALEGPQECVAEIRNVYKDRRDVLVPGLNKLGWPVELPKATMFAWARIPEQYRALGSVEFSKKLLLEAKVAVSPGVGFGEHGDGHVRFSLIENEERTRQALRGIKQMF